MSTTMLEKMTVAAGGVLYGYVDPNDTPGTYHSAQSALLAAIAAMREPDDVMKSAVREIGGMQWVANALATWPTMIDAIISEART